MSYRVRIETFEGPFDLLLYLVSRQKVDIGAISITEIADQYLDEVSRMENLDLDVASDFLLVAATLLEIKAASLIPRDTSEVAQEFEEISPNEARDILVDRLITYKQYKNAAAALGMRFEAEGRMHVRHFGPDPDLLTLMPDYLERVSLDDLAYLCEQALERRDRFLLESEHIAAKPIPVEVHVRGIHSRLRSQKKATFHSLLPRDASPAIVVVTLLAILELYKRGMIDISQPECFGNIAMEYIEGSGDLLLEDDDAITSVQED